MYMKIFLITLISVFAFPLYASAAITYSRSPQGTSITSPVTITVSVDSFSDYGLTPGVDQYYITLDDDYNPQTECFPATQLSASAVFNLPLGDVSKGVLIVGFTGACETGDEPYYLEGNGESTVFTVVAAPAAPSSGGGTLAYRPEVNIFYPKGPALFS